MLHREVYERTPQFEERVAGARLRTYEWQFLANLDGRSTVGEILRRLKIDEPTIAEFIFEQERYGTIAPRLLSFEEFLNSKEAEAIEAVPPAAAPRAPSTPPKRSAAEELRAIARLSIAAALGEIITLISKRRGLGVSSPASERSAAPVDFAMPAAPAEPAPATEPAHPVSDPVAEYFAERNAGFATEFAPEPTVWYAPEPPPPLPEETPPAPGLGYSRDELASFQVFDWTLAAPPVEQIAESEATSTTPETAANGSAIYEFEPQVEAGLDPSEAAYLEALSEEQYSEERYSGEQYSEGGLTIADRVLRDYGPVGEPAAPPASPSSGTDPGVEHYTQAFEHLAFAPEAPPAVEAAPLAEDQDAERDSQRVSFSVYDLGGYTERVEPAIAEEEAPQYDTSQHDAPQHDVPQYETPQYDTPAAATHQVSSAEYELFEPETLGAPAFYAEPFDPQAPQAARENGHDPARKPDETADPAAADPIVFSLSARNPDSFWSGKK